MINYYLRDGDLNSTHRGRGKIQLRYEHTNPLLSYVLGSSQLASVCSPCRFTVWSSIAERRRDCFPRRPWHGRTPDNPAPWWPGTPAGSLPTPALRWVRRASRPVRFRNSSWRSLRSRLSGPRLWPAPCGSRSWTCHLRLAVCRAVIRTKNKNQFKDRTIEFVPCMCEGVAALLI